MNCQSHSARLFLATRREAASELKTPDKERRPAGFLLGGAQRSFMRFVMVVQFHQIRAEISSAPKNKRDCDFTSRSGPSEEPLGELRLHYWSPLVGTKTAFLSHTEVKSEGRSDGRGGLLLRPQGWFTQMVKHVCSVFHLGLRGLPPSQYTNQYILAKHLSRLLKQCDSDMKKNARLHLPAVSVLTDRL